LDPTDNVLVQRLLRGGAWYGGPRYCRSADRDHNDPGNTINYVGFRVCCLPQD
jgi:formylglycine-generating enzyme required for sulfatase activity